MKRTQRIISAIVFIAIIFIMPLIFIFSEKKSFSQEENRSLAKKPEFSFSAIADKSYMSDMDSYLSDNFPNRVGWVKTKKLFIVCLEKQLSTIYILPMIC